MSGQSPRRLVAANDARARAATRAGRRPTSRAPARRCRRPAPARTATRRPRDRRRAPALARNASATRTNRSAAEPSAGRHSAARARQTAAARRRSRRSAARRHSGHGTDAAEVLERRARQGSVAAASSSAKRAGVIGANGRSGSGRRKDHRAPARRPRTRYLTATKPPTKSTTNTVVTSVRRRSMNSRIGSPKK